MRYVHWQNTVFTSAAKTRIGRADSEIHKHRSQYTPLIQYAVCKLLYRQCGSIVCMEMIHLGSSRQLPNPSDCLHSSREQFVQRNNLFNTNEASLAARSRRKSNVQLRTPYAAPGTATSTTNGTDGFGDDGFNRARVLAAIDRSPRQS